MTPAQMYRHITATLSTQEYSLLGCDTCGCLFFLDDSVPDVLYVDRYVNVRYGCEVGDCECHTFTDAEKGGR